MRTPPGLEALVFDFDGMILDTEGPAYRSWQEIFQQHGRSLPLSRWLSGIGTVDGFDPLEELEEALGRPLDRRSLLARRRTRMLEMVEREAPRPGVLEYLAEARRRGLRLAVASTGPSRWVGGHLERLGLADLWDTIQCAESDPRLAKPEPAVYLAVLEELGLEPPQVVAFEDSPPGVAAAKAAGIFCVAVPHALTAHLDLSAADLLVPSLADLPPEDFLAGLEAHPRN